MHIARQTPQELVVVASSRWVSAICVAAAFFPCYFVIVRHEPKGFFLAGLFLLFALIMDLRKTFVFDAVQRTVRWNGRKVFKAESGEIAFEEIIDIGTESRRAGNRNVPIYRLTIVTRRSTIPMAYTFNGDNDGYSGLRGQIMEFLKPGLRTQSSEGRSEPRTATSAGSPR
jgi:hypothetical protein